VLEQKDVFMQLLIHAAMKSSKHHHRILARFYFLFSLVYSFVPITTFVSEISHLPSLPPILVFLTIYHEPLFIPFLAIDIFQNSLNISILPLDSISCLLHCIHYFTHLFSSFIKM